MNIVAASMIVAIIMGALRVIDGKMPVYNDVLEDRQDRAAG
jgi:hypothetical protein